MAAVGVAGLGVAAQPAEGADDKGDVERTFEGESKEGKLQEALDKAIQQLDKALGEDDVRDGLGTWKIAGATGQRGGFAGLRTVKVAISATRSPEWGKK